MIESKLKFIKDFQTKYPTSHVGGSMGLMLHGIDLKRDITFSDVDISIDREYDTMPNDENLHNGSFDSDFSYKFYNTDVENFYYKVEVSVNPKALYDVILYKGVEYNVSRVEDILYWKKKYADMGVHKHRMDLKVISGEDTIDDIGNLPF